MGLGASLRWTRSGAEPSSKRAKLRAPCVCHVGPEGCWALCGTNIGQIISHGGKDKINMLS